MRDILSLEDFPEKEILINSYEKAIDWLRNELNNNPNITETRKEMFSNILLNYTWEKRKLESNIDPIFYGINFENELIKDTYNDLKWNKEEFRLNSNLNVIIPQNNIIPTIDKRLGDPFIQNYFNEYDESIKLMKKEEEED